MQINKIKVNGFGKLNNLDLDFKPGINVVRGSNESGKSTLVDFLRCTFYGISKNKNGNEYSDYDKYLPWGDANFSGSASYSVDGEEYSIYRDFAKNKASLLDKSGNDISQDFAKDKSKGLDIGFSQFNIDEETFVSSICVKQNQVEVDKLSQNSTIQKLGNAIQTGDESLSYDDLQKKLEKLLADEVGSERAFTKPKSMLKKDIQNLEVRESELESNRKRSEQIYDAKQKLYADKQDAEKRLNDLDKVFDIKEKFNQELNEEKIKYDIEQKNKQVEREKKIKHLKIKKIVDTFIIVIETLIVAGVLISKENYLLAGLAIIGGAIGLILDYKFSYNIEDVEIENFEVVSETVRKKQSRELAKLEQEGISKELTEMSYSDIKKGITKTEEKIKELELEIHKYKIEEASLKGGLNELNEVVEDLYAKKDELQDLLKKESIINTAIETLNKSYEEIKMKLIPSIEEDIKYTVSKTTNGKYQEIKYNDKLGLLCMNEFGELVPINKLSYGTIDQIYLGFRMAVADKYKGLPLIFDETFVYFDDERLKNILKTISEIALDKQIIILSCSSREEDALKMLHIDYNIINI